MGDILLMSATAMSSTEPPLLAFHETARPSAETASLPSCFLNWAAASGMLRVCAQGVRSWQPLCRGAARRMMRS